MNIRLVKGKCNKKHSIVDIVVAITESPRPRVYWDTLKNREKDEYGQLYSKYIQLKIERMPRKYWSVQKTRLKQAGNELTTRCSQLKMVSFFFKLVIVKYL